MNESKEPEDSYKQLDQLTPTVTSILEEDLAASICPSMDARLNEKPQFMRSPTTPTELIIDQLMNEKQIFLRVAQSHVIDNSTMQQSPDKSHSGESLALKYS